MNARIKKIKKINQREMQPVVAVFITTQLIVGWSSTKAMMDFVFFGTFVFDQFSSRHKLYV